MALPRGQENAQYGGGGASFEGGAGNYGILFKKFEYVEADTKACQGRFHFEAEICDCELEENEQYIGRKVIGNINHAKDELADEAWAKNNETAVANIVANIKDADGNSLHDLIIAEHDDADSWFDEGIASLLTIRVPDNKVATYLKEDENDNGVFPAMSSTVKPYVDGMFDTADDDTGEGEGDGEDWG